VPRRCSRREGDVLAIGGLVNDEHLGTRHAAASAHGNPGKAGWAGNLEEDGAGGRGAGVGNIHGIAKVAFAGGGSYGVACRGYTRD
jgi:hypothetical protein